MCFGPYISVDIDHPCSLEKKRKQLGEQLHTRERIVTFN